MTGPSVARSLWVHALALGLLMLALLPVTGWAGVFSSDEGAAIAEAKQVIANGSFAVAHPFLAADPDGVAFPFESSIPMQDGFAPLAKKPAYTLLLSLVDRLAGVPGMILLSIAGTIGAAVTAALFARRIRPSLDIPTLWLTGVASPLFIDGYLIIAHALAAAACGGALLAVFRALERRSFARLLVPAVLLALAGTLRAEALVFGLAIGLSLGLLAVARRSAALATLALTALVGTLAGRYLDTALTQHYLGTSAPGATVVVGATRGFLEGRARGFLETWTRPGYGPLDSVGVILVLIALIGMATVLLLHGRPPAKLVRAAALVTMALSLGLVVANPLPWSHLVPGLLLAFPIGAWGVAALKRSDLGDLTAQVLLLTSLLFGLGVLASQIAVGGAWEWGGRFFALGLPAATPLVALGLQSLGRQLDRETAGLCLAAVIAPTFVLSVMGIGSVRYFRDGWGGFVAGVAHTAAGTTAGDGGTPVVITTEPELPRAAWNEMDTTRWLLVARDAVPAMLDRLDHLGIRQLVLVTKGPGLIRPIDSSGYHRGGPPGAPTEGEWWVRTLTAR